MTAPCPHSLPTAYLAGSRVVELIPQLRSTAGRIARRYGHRDEPELLSIGLLAACELAYRFDPSRGAPFATFIRLRVEGAMIEACRKPRLWVPLDPTEHDRPVPSVEEAYLFATERHREDRALTVLHRLELCERERRFVEAMVAHQGSVAGASRASGVPYQTGYSMWRRIAAKVRAEATSAGWGESSVQRRA
jgi:hypothetical protein